MNPKSTNTRLLMVFLISTVLAFRVFGEDKGNIAYKEETPVYTTKVIEYPISLVLKDIFVPKTVYAQTTEGNTPKKGIFSSFTTLIKNIFTKPEPATVIQYIPPTPVTKVEDPIPEQIAQYTPPVPTTTYIPEPQPLPQPVYIPAPTVSVDPNLYISRQEFNITLSRLQDSFLKQREGSTDAFNRSFRTTLRKADEDTATVTATLTTLGDGLTSLTSTVTSLASTVAGLSGGGLSTTTLNQLDTIEVGYGNTASGTYSSASGYSNTASGQGSSASGYNNTASATTSSAFGYCNTASGLQSSSIGYCNIALGEYSATLGYINDAEGSESAAIGVYNTSSGNYSSALGYSNTASEQGSTASGYINTASGENSSAFGFCNTASQKSSTASGYFNTASGYYSSASGYCNVASGQGSSASGYLNTASAYFSSAFGYINTASSETSSAFGSCLTNDRANTTRIGHYNDWASVGLNTGSKLIDTSSGAHLTTGGSWTNSSSKEKKENYTPLDKEEMLEKIRQLNIERWNYKTEDPNNTHIGPYAEDFYELFNTGNDNKAISTIDSAGVALIGVQAIAERLDTVISTIGGGISSTAGAITATFDKIISREAEIEVVNADLVNATNINAKENICIDDVCIDKDKLKKILDNVGEDYDDDNGNEDSDDDSEDENQDTDSNIDNNDNDESDLTDNGNDDADLVSTTTESVIEETPETLETPENEDIEDVEESENIEDNVENIEEPALNTDSPTTPPAPENQNPVPAENTTEEEVI